MTRVIILNGVGSVGKSTLARAIQRAAAIPFLHVQMDSFLEMLPETLQDSAETFHYLPVDGLVRIETGPLGQRLMRGLHHAVTALADEGNDLIFDTVMQKTDAEDCRCRLASHRVLFVGLFAPLGVIEAREKGRGDRMIGLARAQFGDLHDGIRYDLELDLGDMTAEAAARAVLDAVGL